SWADASGASRSRERGAVPTGAAPFAPQRSSGLETSACYLPGMPLSRPQLDELVALLGADAVLASEAARFTYEADALTLDRATPDVIVLPRTTDEVSGVVRWARARGVPVTPRGAGTGLAGGATPECGGVTLP